MRMRHSERAWLPARQANIPTFPHQISVPSKNSGNNAPFYLPKNSPLLNRCVTSHRRPTRPAKTSDERGEARLSRVANQNRAARAPTVRRSVCPSVAVCQCSPAIVCTTSGVLFTELPSVIPVSREGRSCCCRRKCQADCDM